MNPIWNGDEDRRLRELYVSGERRVEIARAMNMTEGAIKTRLFVLPFTAEEITQRKANRRKIKNSMLGATRAWKEQPYKVQPPCEKAIADRNIRASLKHRDLTAELQGDPKPGYSALDRRS